MSDLGKLVDERTSKAEATFAAAIRLDLHSFLGEQVEHRMRTRPHFLKKTPKDLLVEIRKELDRDVEKAADDLMKQAFDLRREFGARPKSNREEGEAVIAIVMQRAQKLARNVLVTNFFPGDKVPDGPQSDVVDDSPVYDLRYTPTVPLVWAWTQVRELDRVRLALDAAKGQAIADTYEVRRHLPEALPAQSW